MQQAQYVQINRKAEKVKKIALFISILSCLLLAVML